MIDIYVSMLMDRALISLAQRTDPSNDNWNSGFSKDGKILSGTLFRCLICRDKILNGASVMIEHGMEHLKEKGLLVFI